MMAASISPYIWLAIGIVRILSELLATSVVMVFFGLAAIFVSALVAFGAAESLTAQLGIFIALSLVLLVVARKQLKEIFKGRLASEEPDMDNGIVGQRTKISKIDEVGRFYVEVNGTTWSALSNQPLETGDIVTVTGIRGISLLVEKEACVK